MHKYVTANAMKTQLTMQKRGVSERLILATDMTIVALASIGKFVLPRWHPHATLRTMNANLNEREVSLADDGVL